MIEQKWAGNPLDVGQRIRAGLASGELVEAELLHAKPGRAVVRVVFAEPALRVDTRPAAPARLTVTRPRPPLWRRPRWIAAGIVAALTFVGLVVWAVVALVAWVLAHLAVILGVIGAAATVVVLAGLAGGSGNGHCPGPWHR